MDNVWTFTNPICVYREKSIEGFACAWSVWKRFGNDIEYKSVSYADKLSNLEGRDVIILDLTCNLDNINYISSIANSITLIDNKTTSLNSISTYSLLGVVDQAQSTCILTWKYFHKSKHPLFFEYIQNREFWKFDLPHSKEIFAAISNYNLTFENYNDLEETYIDDLIIEGQAIVRKCDNDVENILKSFKYFVFKDLRIPTVNSPYFYSSDCANSLADKYGIGCSYFCNKSKIFFSLRSNSGSEIDVSEIAKFYGGDGSKHAAGFIIEPNFEPIQLLLDSVKK